MEEEEATPTGEASVLQDDAPEPFIDEPAPGDDASEPFINGPKPGDDASEPSDHRSYQGFVSGTDGPCVVSP